MSFRGQAAGLLICAFASAMGTPGHAQSPGSNNYTIIEAHPEEVVQLGYYASANKDCSPAPLPAVRVTQAPRLGMLSVRRGMLTTDKVVGCPALKTPAEIAFYEARAGSSGTDHITYEVIDFSGEVGVYDMTIEVKEPSKPSGSGKE